MDPRRAPVDPADPQSRWVSIAPGVTVRRLAEGGGTAMMLYRIDAGTRFDLHRHDFPELGVILSGEARVSLSGEERPVRPGDSYYIPPNTLHGFLLPDAGEPVVLIDVSSELSERAEGISPDAILELARSVTRRLVAPEP